MSESVADTPAVCSESNDLTAGKSENKIIDFLEKSGPLEFHEIEEPQKLDTAKNRYRLKRASSKNTDESFECDTCWVKFTSKNNLRRHQKIHGASKFFECLLCGKQFFRKDLMNEHTMTHVKKREDLECPVDSCLYQFDQYKDLTTHLDIFHFQKNVSTELAKCKLCDRKYDKSHRLLLHFYTGHEESNEKSTSPTEAPPTPKKRKLSEENNYVDDDVDSNGPPDPGHRFLSSLINISDISSSGPIILELPEGTTSIKESEPIDSSDSNENIDASESQKIEKITKCDHCDIEFNDDVMCTIHAMLHTENDPFKCAFCGVQTEGKYTFMTHFIGVHHNISP